MACLLPDNSYCTSDIGRCLFKPKVEWSATACVVLVSESKGLAGTTHNDYHIEITCTPRNSVEQDTRVFTVTSRYRELSRLHGGLSKLHKQLYLRGIFPTYPGARLIGSSDPAVVADRRRSTDAFLSFVLDSEVLRKARLLHEFLERCEEKVATAPVAHPDAFLYEGGQIMDAPITYEDDTPPNYEAVASTTDHEDTSIQSAPSMEFLFPDVTLGRPDVRASASSSKSVMKRLFPKLSTSSAAPSASTTTDDYLVRAGKLVATAQRAELELEYELAFQCYKNAASSLIQGVQRENDMSRRNAIRRKTAKYLVKAEKLFRTYLSYDGSVFNIDSLLASSLQDPNILAFQCSNHSLRNYLIVGVLPDMAAAKRVILVEDKISGKKFVMKLLEKGSSTNSRILLPASAPHMVQLQQFFETETYIILLLEYVDTGLLWTFLARHLCDSETQWLCSLTNDSEKVDVLDGETVTSHNILHRQKTEKYHGRRLLFSVGVDFERVAEMHDQAQSTDDPSTSEVLCTMGEDCTGTATAPSGDFFILANSESVAVADVEETPAAVTIKRLPKNSGELPLIDGASHERSLSSCLSEIRGLFSHRRPSWPAAQTLPDALVVHWMAQLVSWFYIMHNEHQEFIGDFCPDDILIANDGNLLVTYHGVWHNDNRSRSLMDGYAAPESALLSWMPSAESDVWTLGSLLFELLTGRSLANAAPHGIESCEELPIPKYVSTSLVARDLLSLLLEPIDTRISMEEVRSHRFFSSIDWTLYDNPYSRTADANTSPSVGSVSSSSTSSSSLHPTNLGCLPLDPSRLMQIATAE